MFENMMEIVDFLEAYADELSYSVEEEQIYARICNTNVASLIIKAFNKEMPGEQDVDCMVYNWNGVEIIIDRQ